MNQVENQSQPAKPIQFIEDQPEEQVDTPVDAQPTIDPREARKEQWLDKLLALTNQGFVDAFLENPVKTASYGGVLELMEAHDVDANQFAVSDLCNSISNIIYDLKARPDYEVVTEQQAVAKKAQELLDAGKLSWKAESHTTPSSKSEVLRGFAILDGYKISITQVHTWRNRGNPFNSTKITDIRKIKEN